MAVVSILGGFVADYLVKKVTVVVQRSGVVGGGGIGWRGVVDFAKLVAGEPGRHGGDVRLHVFVWDCEFELLDAGAECGAPDESGASHWVS